MAKSGVKVKVPIILMAWPIVGYIIALMAYIAINFALGASGSLTGNDSMVDILNITLFVIGLVSVVLGTPSFIIGAVLLILRLTAKRGSSRGLGIAGMVLGISSIITFLFGIGFIAGVIGICLSAAAIKRSRDKKGMAVAGLVTSIVGIFISFVVLIVIIMAAYSGVSDEATTSANKVNASTISSNVDKYYVINGVYPSYSELMGSLIDDNVSGSVIDSVGAYGSVKSVEYIPCNGDGGQVWYWDVKSEKYYAFSSGDTSKCQY